MAPSSSNLMAVAANWWTIHCFDLLFMLFVLCLWGFAFVQRIGLERLLFLYGTYRIVRLRCWLIFLFVWLSHFLSTLFVLVYLFDYCFFCGGLLAPDNLLLLLACSFLVVDVVRFDSSLLPPVSSLVDGCCLSLFVAVDWCCLSLHVAVDRWFFSLFVAVDWCVVNFPLCPGVVVVKSLLMGIAPAAFLFPAAYGPTAADARFVDSFWQGVFSWLPFPRLYACSLHPFLNLTTPL